MRHLCRGRRVTALGIAVLIMSTLVPGAHLASAGKLAQTDGRLNAQPGGCGGAAADGTFGTVWLERWPGNLVSVRVRITKGLPNENYTINVSCAGDIGTMTTDRHGHGTVRIPPTAAHDLATTTAIVIDVHLTAPPYSGAAQTAVLTLPML